jgi:N utilization substance protein A
MKIPDVDQELAERLVEQGILGYDDLSVMEVDSLVATIEGLSEELAEHLIQSAETLSEQENESDSSGGVPTDSGETPQEIVAEGGDTSEAGVGSSAESDTAVSDEPRPTDPMLSES